MNHSSTRKALKQYSQTSTLEHRYKLETTRKLFDGDTKNGKLLDSDGDLIPTRCTAIVPTTTSLSSGKSKVFSCPAVDTNENVAMMETGEYRCEKCGKTYNHKSSLWYHLKSKTCEKKTQEDNEYDAELRDLVNDVVTLIKNNNKKRKISSSDELCQNLRDAATKSNLVLRDGHILTLLGKDAFSVSFDELMERLFNVLMVEGHSGFISIIEETKQEDDEETKTPIQKKKNEKGGRKSERAAASKAKRKLKDDWKVIGTPDRTPSRSTQKKRRKRVEPFVIENRRKTMLKFLISLDSSRQRFLYPAEMYFEEIHREQANEASTYRERAEKMNMERELDDMHRAERETRMSNLYEQAQERFRKGWQSSEAVPPLRVR